DGVVFDQHFVDCPEPAAARRGWRTGRHPLAPVLESPDLIAELRHAGVRTARVGPSLSADDPWAAGWDYDGPSARDANDPLGLKPTRRAVRQALDVVGGTAN